MMTKFTKTLLATSVLLCFSASVSAAGQFWGDIKVDGSAYADPTEQSVTLDFSNKNVSIVGGIEDITSGTETTYTDRGISLDGSGYSAVIKAKDNDTVVTGRSLNTPVRILKNHMSRQYLALEKTCASAEELEKLTLGALRRAVFDGDIQNGSVMMGQIAGLCDQIKPLKVIFKDICTSSTKTVEQLNEAVKNL